MAGVTLVAFGGGAPDIFAAVSAFTAPDPNVARLAVVNGLKIDFKGWKNSFLEKFNLTPALSEFDNWNNPTLINLQI